MERQDIKRKLERLLGKKVGSGLLQQSRQYNLLEVDFANLLLELTDYCLLLIKRGGALKEIGERHRISAFKLRKLLAVVNTRQQSKTDE